MTIRQKAEKIYLLSHTFAEVAKDTIYTYFLMTANGKTIPTDGSRVFNLSEVAKKAPKDFECEKVITHKDGTITAVYNGLFVKWMK